IGSPLATSVKIHTESKNEIPTAGTAIQCARSRIQWPNSPMIRNAANGNNGMRTYFMLLVSGGSCPRIAQRSWAFRRRGPADPAVRPALHLGAHAVSPAGHRLFFVCCALPFHQVELFGGDGGLAAVERDDDRQPH